MTVLLVWDRGGHAGAGPRGREALTTPDGRAGRTSAHRRHRRDARDETVGGNPPRAAGGRRPLAPARRLPARVEVQVHQPDAVAPSADRRGDALG